MSLSAKTHTTVQAVNLIICKAYYFKNMLRLDKNETLVVHGKHMLQLSLDKLLSG